MLIADKFLTNGMVVFNGMPPVVVDVEDSMWSISQDEKDLQFNTGGERSLKDAVAHNIGNLILDKVSTYGPINANNLMPQYWSNIKPPFNTLSTVHASRKISDFPPLLSPFPWTWIEAEVPINVLKAWFGVNYSKRQRIRWAMLYQTTPLKDGVLEISRDEPWMSDAPFRHWQNIASLVEGVETDASYLATAIIFVDLGKVMKKIVGPISAMQFLLDKNGSYMTEETNSFATLVEEAMQNQYNASVDGSVDGNPIHNMDRSLLEARMECDQMASSVINYDSWGNITAEDARIIPNVEEAMMETMVSAPYNRFMHSTKIFGFQYTDSSVDVTAEPEMATHITTDNIVIEGMKSLLWSIGFLNCSNVGTVRVKNNPKKERKFKKQNNRSPLQYRMITVSPHLSQVNEHSDEVVNQRDLPLHVVRGHFRKYTKDKPLFGRLHGTFWIPAHAKGSKDHGEIAHEYEVNKEEEL